MLFECVSRFFTGFRFSFVSVHQCTCEVSLMILHLASMLYSTLGSWGLQNCFFAAAVITQSLDKKGAMFQFMHRFSAARNHARARSKNHAESSHTCLLGVTVRPGEKVSSLPFGVILWCFLCLLYATGRPRDSMPQNWFLARPKILLALLDSKNTTRRPLIFFIVICFYLNGLQIPYLQDIGNLKILENEAF